MFVCVCVCVYVQGKVGFSHLCRGDVFSGKPWDICARAVGKVVTGV